MQRLSPSESDANRIQYESNPLYKITYQAISTVGGAIKDLSAEEIWNEAEKVMKECQVMDTSGQKWKFQHLYTRLLNRYQEFTDWKGETIRRSDEEANHTAVLVLYDVLYMLIVSRKVDGDNIEEHPYYAYIQNILSKIGNLQIYEIMETLTHYEEEQYEKDNGVELLPRDYLNPRGIEREVVCPLLEKDKEQQMVIIQILREAANQPKTQKSKYEGANRDHLSCALKALEEMKKLPTITTHYAEIVRWLTKVLGMFIDSNAFRECFDTSSKQKRKKTQDYADQLEKALAFGKSLVVANSTNRTPVELGAPRCSFSPHHNKL